MDTVFSISTANGMRPRHSQKKRADNSAKTVKMMPAIQLPNNLHQCHYGLVIMYEGERDEPTAKETIAMAIVKRTLKPIEK